MTTRFEPFVRALLGCESIEEERELIGTEQANMRTLIKEGDETYTPRIVAKLMFLAMRGENTAYGQMEVLKLMANDRYSYKRIGYLAAMALLNESTELLVLITETVHKDLHSSNPENQKLALNLISNIITVDMSQSLNQDVLKLLEGGDRRLLKPAVMAAFAMIKKDKDLVETFLPIVPKLLNNENHAVQIGGIHLALLMLQIQPELADSWKHFSDSFAKILKGGLGMKSFMEYSFNGYDDPFRSVMMLRLIGALKNPSEVLDSLLSFLCTGLELRLNTGRAILLQCVQTIGEVASKSSLKSLAFNEIGKLLASSDHPNVLYSALSAFSRILYSNNQMLDRSSSDSMVLQRYKSNVVKCLSHADPSIRRRALDVVAALVDETNVESLVPEVMSYLKMADSDFRTELVAKIFASVQRFAPNILWNYDTILKLITDSGNYVGSDVIVAFCRLIARHLDLRTHALVTLSDALKTNNENQTLLQVGAWALGEFLDDPTTVIDTMMELMNLPQTVVETKLIIITALCKIATRLNIIEKVKEHLKLFINNNNLEVQQRVGEMLRTLEKPEICASLLAPIEVDEVEGAAQKSNKDDYEADLLDLGNTAPVEQPAPHTDLIAQLQAAESQPQPTQRQEPQTPAVQGPPGSVEAVRTPDYVIFFEVQRNASNPNQLAIRSTVFNLGNVPLTNFMVQYGIPQGWAVKAMQPTGTVLEPLGGGPIQQVLMLQNSGTAPLRMMTQISYMYRTQPIKEMNEVNPIFNTP